MFQQFINIIIYMDLQKGNVNLHKYKDYKTTEERDYIHNKDISDRIFDITSLSTKSKSELVELDGYETQMCQWIPYNTHYNNVQQASTPFIQMKHAQKYETLIENPNSTITMVEHLKNTQNDEIQKQSNQIQMTHALKYQKLKYTSPIMLQKNKFIGTKISSSNVSQQSLRKEIQRSQDEILGKNKHLNAKNIN